MRRSSVALLGVVSLLALTSSSASAKTEMPDVKVLIPRATALVVEEFPGAVFLEAKGRPATGEVAMDAEDIVQWEFVFATHESEGFPSAMVLYGPPPDAFGAVIPRLQYWTGAREIPKAPPVTLKDAVKLLRKAGHTCAFDAVDLSHPLVADPVNPRYLFQCIGPLGGRHHVAVDTVTRDVFVVD